MEPTNNIEKLEEYVNDKGVTGISGGRFKPITNKEGKVIPPNTTVRKYCEDMAALVNTARAAPHSILGIYHSNRDSDVTAEEYAGQILDMVNAPSKLVMGECRDCWGFVLEGEPHVCTEEYKNGVTYNKRTLNKR